MNSGLRSFASFGLSLLLASSLFLGGCDDVEIIRDPEIHVSKGMTWAWRPRNASADTRAVLSRDVLRSPQPAAPPPQHLESNRDWNTEANRNQLQQAIERALKSKGLVQVTDPNTADFWVDYHLAVKTYQANVASVYPGGYPGVTCGPYGCWSGWGWGAPEVEYQTVQYHDGTFVIDVGTRTPRKLAYRAISRKQLSNKPSISPYQAEESVNALLKGLKPQ